MRIVTTTDSNYDIHVKTNVRSVFNFFLTKNKIPVDLTLCKPLFSCQLFDLVLGRGIVVDPKAGHIQLTFDQNQVKQAMEIPYRFTFTRRSGDTEMIISGNLIVEN